jgi:hypothetical protein
LHTFFGLAHFWKKPCNPVFKVHQFFKKAQNFLSMFFVANFGMIILKSPPLQGLSPKTSPADNSAVTTDIPPDTKEEYVIFRFID